MTNHPNRSKQQQAKHTPTMDEIEAEGRWVWESDDRTRAAELMAERDRLKSLNAELLAALKAARPHLGVGYSAIQRHGITSQVDAAIAKAEGR